MKKLGLEDWKKYKLVFWTPCKNVRGNDKFCIYQDLLRKKTVGEIITELSKTDEYYTNSVYMFNLYINCVKYGFRKDMIPWTCPDKKKNTKKWMGETIEELENFYSSKDPMTVEEIDAWLKGRPLVISGRTIKDGLHRSFAMMGRILRNEPYVEFYVK